MIDINLMDTINKKMNFLLEKESPIEKCL